MGIMDDDDFSMFDNVDHIMCDSCLTTEAYHISKCKDCRSSCVSCEDCSDTETLMILCYSCKRANKLEEIGI